MLPGPTPPGAGSPGSSPSGPSLRDRRRDQTRRSIHDATLELSHELGFAQVTVDAISARAGVSPRTFFNYFPSKEAAVVLDPPVQLRGERAERFAAGPTTPPRELLLELSHLLLEQLETSPVDRAAAEGLFVIASQHPSVFAHMVGQLDAVRLELADAATRRLGPDSEPQVAHLVASLAMAAVRSGLEDWAAGRGHGGEDSPVPHVRRAIEIVTDLSGPAG